MAKQKKRGFFSWLGLGRQEEENSEQPQTLPESGETAHSDPDAQIVSTEASAPQEAERQPLNPDDDAPAPVEREEAAEAADEAPLGEMPEESEVVDKTVDEPVTATAQKAVPQAVEGLDSSAQTALPEDVLLQEEALETARQDMEDAASRAQPEAEPEAVDDEPLAVIVAQAEVLEDEPAESVEETVLTPTAPPQEQERPAKEGFFSRLKRSLVKTRQNLGSGFVSLFRGKKIDDDLFEELEEQLLIADVGMDTTRKIIASLTEHASRKQLKDAEALMALLKEEMAAILEKVDEPLNIEGKTPFVILMVGVNGVGKTTTIGKMARQYQAQGKSVMLAAGDTFRAAAVEQLQIWGERNNVPVVAQHTGADSASVIFDAIQAAKARGVDVLIADTAGRLQNKSHLMEELKKIVRVMKKLDDQAPHEVMLTLDASTGQNAVSQAKLFNEAVGLSGIALTKLDGTAKGGVIFAIADQFGIPIRYIGVGERIEDLRPFKADDFIEALFARED
ncbi:signal recognition particle-docking protein FtsY [Lonsdalea populi]|uniref:signal recognition particle-docking protein FtsY n=1 Tax=Lonsdalea populi TaxID=1172565 RepID=UPI000A24B8EA|nr:signal recognition particle-docking protein FtsY [Lonsdalea populi]OSM95230.1 signal recognition particle-docking protein FtsY [Lonsdalea populi]RAT69265.1 signal recognition particle-docking protein FtsY [Lonsdalea populi]RAT74634.1 signal recognition particle-docking protein FtsY [Lonsdalea populi]RAT76795.1 signal recognition particle-docking protein FtsY [Lonsdalea populi]RAT77812.1 signal recognition particle-docking protein FtsY [Lonsdalea populi]